MTIVNVCIAVPEPKHLPRVEYFGDRVRRMASDSKTRRYVDALWRALEPYKGQTIRVQGFVGHPLWLDVAVEYGIEERTPGHKWMLHGAGIVFPVLRFRGWEYA